MADDFWWIIVIGIIIWALLLHIHIYLRYHYICPKCSTSFKPTFIRSLTAINAAEYRKMKCPHCNYSSYMEAIKDNKKHK